MDIFKTYETLQISFFGGSHYSELMTKTDCDDYA